MLSIDADDVGLQLSGVFRLADVGHHDGRIAHGLQRQVVDLIHHRNLAVGIDVVILGANAHIACRKNQVGLVQRIHHIRHAHLVGFQFERIDVDHDLPIASAVGLRHRRSRNIRHLIANTELGKIL